jgi:multiple sugar transport system ATP-binding protein
MRTELAKLHLRLGTTFIYVTHDQVEAMTMGDRIVVMKDGFIQQVDTPGNLYTKPCNTFVAGFMGSPQMNFIDAKVVQNGGAVAVEFGEADQRYSAELPESKLDAVKPYIGKDVIMGIRPEHLHDEEMFLSVAKTGVIDATVEVSEMMGAETYLYLTSAGCNWIARVSPRTNTKAGDQLKIAIDVTKIHLFDKDTEKTITN